MSQIRRLYVSEDTKKKLGGKNETRKRRRRHRHHATQSKSFSLLTLSCVDSTELQEHHNNLTGNLVHSVKTGESQRARENQHPKKQQSSDKTRNKIHTLFALLLFPYNSPPPPPLPHHDQNEISIKKQRCRSSYLVFSRFFKKKFCQHAFLSTCEWM